MRGALTIDDAAIRERVGANLRAIAGTVRESGATPIFLTYPAGGTAFKPANDAIRAAASATSTRLIDLTALFAREQASRHDPLLIPEDNHPYPAGYELMAGAVCEAILEQLGVAPPSAVAEAVPVSREIDLAIAADSPSALVVSAAPNRAFHIVISGSLTPRLRLRRCDLDLGDDELVRLSLKLPSLRGVTDAEGRARVELPADALRSFAPGADGLRAAALLLDPRTPKAANVRIWAEAASGVVLLRPAAAPSQPVK